jgi:hypothetical protein
MKIVRHPYHASINPGAAKPGSLWHFVVRVDGSTEVIAHEEASSKEDACCAAMLELVRLQRKNGKPAIKSSELRRA